MGLRGPAPKPSATKRAEGTYRQDRAAGGQEPVHPNVQDLRPPPWLADLAREKWAELATQLDRSGVLKATDVDTLAAYCSAYAQWRPAQEAMAKVLEESPDEDAETFADYKRRLTTYRMVATEALKQMQVWGDRLGLSPSQRTKVSAEAKPGAGVPLRGVDSGGASGLLN